MMQKLGFSIVTPDGEYIRVDPPEGDTGIYKIRIEHPGEAMMVIELNVEEMGKLTDKLVALVKE